MRISSLAIKNFKRFTDLQVLDVPDSAKLVLLIGANGSGKSSIFDAFNWIGNVNKTGEYFEKNGSNDISVHIKLTDGRTIERSKNGYLSGSDLVAQFYGRSSNRVIPRISTRGNISAVKNDEDAPQYYIDPDNRFQNDVFKYINDINQALREPVFEGKSADTIEIFKQFVDPLNQALRNVLGTDERIAIQIFRFEEADHPNQPSKLLFKKGEVIVNYDLLSHGEKQVVTLLLNFLVRNRYHQDTIYYIDEMDVHLNTAIQYALLQEIVQNWIPEGCQLWTASHSLGFIRFAQEFENAATFDFDELDYDQAQTLYPVPKENANVYDIVVGKEFLPSLLQHYKLCFVEGNDKDLYANINLRDTLFIGGGNRDAVFHSVCSTEILGIVDRDFLTDDDILEIQNNYPKVCILSYYSIENYLFHPDNIFEYYKKLEKDFDRASYIQAILVEKNKIKNSLSLEFVSIRQKYPYFKEPAFDRSSLRRRFLNADENIDQAKGLLALLESDNFEDFYKIIPMKNHCTQLPQRQNKSKKDLAKTDWFKNEIRKVLSRTATNNQ